MTQPERLSLNEAWPPDPNDLTIEAYDPRPPGGQRVVAVCSGVRITHKPTGISVVADSEKSQLRNKEQALIELRALLNPAITSREDGVWCEVIHDSDDPPCPGLDTYGYNEMVPAIVAEHVAQYGCSVRYTRKTRIVVEPRNS